MDSYLMNLTFSSRSEILPGDPDYWTGPATANCEVIRVFGILLCIAAFVGIVCNGSLFVSFIQYQALRSPSNIFFMFIAGLGLLTSSTILPLTGSSSVYCRWLYTEGGCKFDAVIAFLYGTASAYLLCAASMSRCYIIVRPFQAKNVTPGRCVIISIVAVLFAFFWTVMPLLGWNEYTMERSRTSCCINWYKRTTLYTSYSMCLFVFIYCIPLVILVTTNTITLVGLKRMHDKIELGIQTALSRKRVEMERRIVKSIIFTTLGFLVTWTPYTVTFFVSLINGDYNTISPLLAYFSAIFAKSSVIWIPIIYIGTSTHYRIRFVNFEALEAQIGSNRVDVGATEARSQAPTAVPRPTEKNPTHLNAN